MHTKSYLAAAFLLLSVTFAGGLWCAQITSAPDQQTTPHAVRLQATDNTDDEGADLVQTDHWRQVK